jgi:hypothetical protein
MRIALKKRAGELRVDLYAGGPLSGGSVAFPGAYPGRYRIAMPDVGRWFGRSGVVSNGGAAIQGARVRLYDNASRLLSETTTSQTGTFLIGGRLRTQSGLRLEVVHTYDPHYAPRIVAGLDSTVNQDESLGTLTLTLEKTEEPA